jgi:hypothetical protein
MRYAVPFLVVTLLSNTLAAQCENGVCRVPAKRPVLSAVASVAVAPIAFVAEHKPVRTVAVNVVQAVATVPQVVRQAKPVRTAIRRLAPMQRVGNALRGVRRVVSFRRCGG